jgi:hypothetical protein
MNKGLTLKLLGIMFASIIVLACTSKKSEAELAMEAKIAEMEKQLAALSGTGNEAKTAELQAELQTAQAGLQTERGNRDRQGGRRNQAETQAAAGSTAADGAATVTTAQTQTTSGGTQTTATTTTTQSQTQAAAQTVASDFKMDGTTLIEYTGSSRSVVIPNGVTRIEYGAFMRSHLTSVTIPEGVTYIGPGAFIGSEFGSTYNQLTSVTIPNSVTYIGEYAFYLNKLTSVTLGNRLTTIGKGAFQQNEITSITIPNSVTTIKEQAFKDNKLTRITLGNGLTTIEMMVFDGNNLTGSLVIPDCVTTIEHAAFRRGGPGGATSLTLGKNVASIESHAFCWANLTSVTIPESVRTIGGWAFHQENPISRVTFKGIVKLETLDDPKDGPFDENLHNVYFGTGLYIRDSNGNWTVEK